MSVHVLLHLLRQPGVHASLDQLWGSSCYRNLFLLLVLVWGQAVGFGKKMVPAAAAS